MYYIKYMPYKSIKNASRNRRELSAASEYGLDTIVFSCDDASDASRNDGGFSVINDGTLPYRPGMGKAAKIAMIARNRFAVYRRTLRLPADVWSCHDLHSLKIAYFVTRFARKRPQFIYDSHEFELGRNAKRSRLKTMLVRLEEGFLIKRCVFPIMVNDTIADEVQKIYKLEQRPVVVRSTPERWETDDAVCKATREGFMKVFADRGADVTCIVMYHGILMTGRGLEKLIEAVSGVNGAGLVIVGNGSDAYINKLAELAEKNGAADRVMFHPAVAISELWKYIGAADISAAPIEPVAKSYYYSLPNKFFESIQSMTPVIASDLPEMRRLIDKYEIGLTFDPGDAGELADCIRKMMEDKSFYDRCKSNMARAKEELCWENEKKVLIRALKENLPRK